ncbi:MULTISPECIES: heavy metal translocating P-type ATPase [Heyndrickxia]|jgi:Cd2+/Zn2+-exporting ATPase|uniref:heavy metal translocating P-type ATPase n=1 Tax=Heyndrickxia TaxID=2837504 RepID=UPI002430D524|nr:heavy metal translocating P-type ATPase [Heyndrickxia oleronia]MCI1613779.1 cadmium-translocating P-type ATPase [Heyndrickxia oleronia]MCI1744909.1 cadmium-translocating P-type ATPase [Heyndrickxia oleronia]MCI1761704.1 cadmium-translocating P-type ATPase [Heyndrickxia oleronia]
MAEYKLQGLSCANCAREMEEEIHKLEHGEDAKVLYNTSKLIVNDEISLAQVERILATDGAAIQKDDHDGHDHAHSHAHSNRLLKLFIIVSAVLYFLAMFVGKASEGAAIALFIIAAAISGYQTFIQGVKNLFRLKFNIDTLMTIALIGAFSIGEWKEGTLVAILFGINEFLEGLGMEKARNSMASLLKVAPKEALLIEAGRERIVSIESLRAGDTVLVKPGEKIPSDGVVLEGKSSVNEAAITGESLPVEKSINQAVYGGSINNEGILKITITKSYEDSSLAKILHLVEEAQETKTPTEQFINHFAKYYTPIIILIAIIVMVIPPLFVGGDWGKWFYQGLAVLIVGCPCALVLSSPIAIVSGITRNARNGILIKGGVFLEQLGKINTIAFDKTGTLTKGQPIVEAIKQYDEKFFTVAGSVENASSHPLAKAVMKKVEEVSSPIYEVSDVNTLSGKGIVANVNGSIYFVGNEKGIPQSALTEQIKQEISEMKNHGYTLVAVANEEKVLGIMGISDEIRGESKVIIDELQQLGIKHTVMLTGDHEKTAEKVAKQIGLTNYFAGLLPDEKVAKVKELTQSGKVAMVGDGINDAPALASADLGIAMGKGTDSAIETADIVLMQDHLGKLPSAIRISKRVNRIIKLNISLALGLKLIALLLTIPGWLTLWIAILSDMGATVLVTLISLTVLIRQKHHA